MALNLLFLAREGNLKDLESIVQTQYKNNFSAVANIQDEFGAGVMHYAARSDSLNTLKYLANTCKLNPTKCRTTKLGNSPAHDSAAAGRLDCLKWFLSLNGGLCPMQDQDSEGLNVLHVAAHMGHAEIVKWLLQESQSRNINLINEKTKTGATPLHFAALSGSLDIVEELIKTNPRLVDAEIQSGVTAAMFASQEGHLPVIKALKNYKANLMKSAKDGMCCTHSAAQNGHTQVLKWLVEVGGLPLSQRDSLGASPLHYAATEGHTETVTWLLNQQAPILADHAGGTPLHNAAASGRIDCVRLLVKRGIDPSVLDKVNLNSLDFIEQNIHKEMNRVVNGFELSENKSNARVTNGIGQVGKLTPTQFSPYGGGSPTQRGGDLVNQISHQMDSHNFQLVNGDHVRNNNSNSSNERIYHIPNSEKQILVHRKDGSDSPKSSMINARSGKIPDDGKSIAIPPPPPLPPMDYTPYSKQDSWMEKLKKKKTQNSYISAPPVVLRNARAGGSETNHVNLIEELKKFNSKSLKKTPVKQVRNPRSKSENRPASVFDSNQLNQTQSQQFSQSTSDLNHQAVSPQSIKNGDDFEGNVYAVVGDRQQAASNGDLSYAKTGLQCNLEDYTAAKFIPQIPLEDDNYRPIPVWKRHMLAKQLAEKTYKEDCEKAKKESEEAKYRNLPPWKRAILERKEASHQI